MGPSHYLLAGSALLFLLSGLVLLTCALLQIRHGISDLAGYQLNLMFGTLRQGQLHSSCAMFSVLPLPLRSTAPGDGEMQVVEGEFLY